MLIFACIATNCGPCIIPTWEGDRAARTSLYHKAPLLLLFAVPPPDYRRGLDVSVVLYHHIVYIPKRNPSHSHCTICPANLRVLYSLYVVHTALRILYHNGVMAAHICSRYQTYNILVIDPTSGLKGGECKGAYALPALCIEYYYGRVQIRTRPIRSHLYYLSVRRPECSGLGRLVGASPYLPPTIPQSTPCPIRARFSVPEGYGGQ